MIAESIFGELFEMKKRVPSATIRSIYNRIKGKQNKVREFILILVASKFKGESNVSSFSKIFILTKTNSP